jgi:hypothetical protein
VVKLAPQQSKLCRLWERRAAHKRPIRRDSVRSVRSSNISASDKENSNMGVGSLDFISNRTPSQRPRLQRAAPFKPSS